VAGGVNYATRSRFVSPVAKQWNNVTLMNRAPAKDLLCKDFVGRGRATLATLQFEFA
jgi:hypothetical protein